MPHDANGNLLQVGDRVLIEAEVMSVQPAEEYCNCTVKTVKAMPPYPDGTTVTLNTRQVTKLEPAPAPEATPVPE